MNRPMARRLILRARDERGLESPFTTASLLQEIKALRNCYGRPFSRSMTLIELGKHLSNISEVEKVGTNPSQGHQAIWSWRDAP